MGTIGGFVKLKVNYFQLARKGSSSDNMGTMKNINQSLLYPINDQFADVTDFEAGKTLVLEYLKSLDTLKGTNVRDVRTMIHTLEHSIHDLRKLQFWFYNNLQAYAGCKLIKLDN